MADNIAITAGTGTTVATDDVGGVQYQKIKIDVGGDGASAALSTSNPLPVSDAGGSLTVDGTVTVADLPLSQASTTSGQKGVLVQGAVTTGAPSYTNAQTAPLSIDTNGALRVTGGTAATQYAEDAAHVSGDTGMLTLAVRRDTQSSLSSADGDYTPLQLTATGSLRVAIAEDGVGSTTDTEDGTVTAAQASVALVIGMGYEYDGTNWTRPRGEHTVAHDAADAGNPAKLGAKAETALSGITLVADGDRSDLYCGIDGVLITRPYCNLEDAVSGNASNTDGTSTSVIASSGAGVRTYITTAIITNMHASTDAYVELKDGTTVMATIPAPHASGATVTFPVPLKGTAATAWNFDPSAAVTTLYCTLVGFKSKV